MRVSRAAVHASVICRRQLHAARALYEEQSAWRKYDHDRYYSLLIDSDPPGDEQLDRANQFFTRSAKQFLMTTPKFQSLPSSDVPEVAFVGRSNIGKSSLINALLGTQTKKGKHTDLARTSRRAGKTRYLSTYGVGDVRVLNSGKSGQHDERGERQFESWSASGPALVVLDTPGYGHASVASWGEAVIKYLVARKQLRQTFVLISPQNGMKSADIQMLKLLSEHAIPFQLVLSKFDQILFPNAKKRAGRSPERLPYGRQLLVEYLNEGTKHCGLAFIRNVYGCSSESTAPPWSQSKIGIASLRVAIMKVAGLETGGGIQMPSE